MTNEDLKKIIKVLVEVLDNKVTWALFGSAAIAVYYGGMYREINDVDVIVDSDNDTITNLFKEKSITVEVRDRHGRHRGYLKINDIHVELMFMIANKTISLPGGNYSFDKIEHLEIGDLEVPVVDLPSLLKAKDKYRIFLENKKKTEGLTSGAEKKIKNTYLDIEKIKEKIR
jgi:hypothetical protein